MHLLLLIIQFILFAYSTGAKYQTRPTFSGQAPHSVVQIICSRLEKSDNTSRQYHPISPNPSSLSWNSPPTNQYQRSSSTRILAHWSPSAMSYSMPLQRAQYQIQNRGQIRPMHRTATEQVMTNVKTYSPCCTSTSNQRQQMSADGKLRRLKGRKKVRVQRPDSNATIKKDLFAMQQDTVGPPGQQRPSNFIRKQFSSPSLFTSGQSSSIRIPNRSSRTLSLSVERHNNNNNNRSTIKRSEQSIMSTSSRSTDERLKALACMDLNCLCPFLNGSVKDSECYLLNGRKLSMAIRKEYRQLSAEERQRFHNALNQLKRNGVYDIIAEWHSNPELSGGAHSGPAFLPWHREYIKRLEIALRLIDPDISLPYWDSTLENAIPETDDTILFSEELMGENDEDGNITNGFMSHWFILEGSHIIRQPAQKGRPLNEDDIQAVMKHSNVINVLAYTAPRSGCKYPTDWTSLEYSHANALMWVGGDMFYQTTSAADPLFFLHHAFVDSIWEDWRQHRQHPDERSNSYPPDLPECSGKNHFAQNFMRPFEPLRNIDGISNNYTEALYRYAQRPKCPAGQDEQCGSKFLFCDLSHGYARCSTKIRLGRNCSGYTHQENPCYNGLCQSGYCAAKKVDHDGSEKRTKSTEEVEKEVSVDFMTTLITSATPTIEKVDHDGSEKRTESTEAEKEDQCFNSHECCSIWANKSECETNEKMMSTWCPVSCGKCIPQYNTTNECSDRHSRCSVWVTQGKCDQNQLWMAENCRSSCQQCNKTREDICKMMLTDITA